MGLEGWNVVMRLRVLFTGVFVCMAASWAPSSQAQEPSNPWRLLAEGDARAALELIERNHPGADASLHDAAFLDRLRIARSHMEERLPQVDSYPAYNALMSGLAADFGDRHVWSTPLVQFPYRAWAGIILSRRSGKWVVGAQERTANDPDLIGHRLVSCGGIEAESWGKERIGLFKGNPEVEAQLAENAAWLLIRDGNPFLRTPKSCVFEAPSGARNEIVLEFRQTTLTDIEPFIARAEGAKPMAGLGVKPFVGGYWIHLETLEPDAAQVVAEVAALEKELRASPMVVLDLRGNGGGDSSYVEAIANTLAGGQAVDEAERPTAKCRGAFWRVSPGNLEALRGWRDKLKGGDAQSFAYVSGLAQDMEAGLDEGRAFAPALPDCAGEPSTQAEASLDEKPTLAMSGRLVLVTDRSCFSSCLVATDLFRRLGAVHVGEATDVSTRYMELRQEVLPSGIRTFSTLQKVALGLEDFGPYEPAIVYPGDLAQTVELQQWVAELPEAAEPLQAK